MEQIGYPITHIWHYITHHSTFVLFALACSNTACARLNIPSVKSKLITCVSTLYNTDFNWWLNSIADSELMPQWMNEYIFVCVWCWGIAQFSHTSSFVMRLHPPEYSIFHRRPTWNVYLAAQKLNQKSVLNDYAESNSAFNPQAFIKCHAYSK